MEIVKNTLLIVSYLATDPVPNFFSLNYYFV